MRTLKILAHPRFSLFSELFPYYRWRDELKNHGINVEFYNDSNDKGLLGGDYLLIQSKYFSKGWQNINTRTKENEEELIQYLTRVKLETGKLIWFDQSASTGSLDFPIINLVDIFVVKQMLKDTSYYVNPTGNKNLRIWLNPNLDFEDANFVPCPPDQLFKLRLGWNTGYNDYRQFRWKFKRLSNYISYSLYPLNVTNAKKPRSLDLSYRGRIKYDNKDLISIQRNSVLAFLDDLGTEFNVLKGSKVSRKVYLRELADSKVSISPFGYGEVCYRDFESLIAGALLIKPSMDHLVTFPDIYIPNETYVPIAWDLSDLKEKFEEVINNYEFYQHIAVNGQQNYLNIVNDPANFIGALKKIID